MQAHLPTRRPVPGLPRRLTPALIWLGVVAVFLATRLPFLDADIPDWTLSQYAPLDEFGYTIPAFNLVHYGTWVHQATSFSSLEGWPMNVAQNLVVAATLRIGGNDFWGFRASSVVFGLVAFLALLAIARRQADDAVRAGSTSIRLGQAVTVAAGVLLLVDFSSLISARIVEPTVSRLAAAAVLFWLVGRGTFLGPRHGLRRSAVFGASASAAVLFVYIYNAFLVPAALVAVAWWAFRYGGRRAARRHAIAFLVGCAVVTFAYYGLVYLIYTYSPIDWYRTWIGSFSTSTRFTGLSLAKALSILDANVFKLDPAFLGVVLVSLPVSAWNLVRRPTAFTVLVAAGIAFFVAQSAYVADYPERKFLLIMLLALPVAASGILHLRAFQAWVLADHRRVVAATLWLSGVLLLTVIRSPLGRDIPHGALLARVILIGGALGVAALVAVLVERRPRLVAAASVALGVAILGPLLYADGAFVYRHPTFTYRDATIAVGRTIDGQVIAGSLSTAMQLNNTSQSIISSYFYQPSAAKYEADLLRVFRSGLATSLFSYADPKTRAFFAAAGFRLVDTYPIILPLGRQLGRYVYAPGAAPGPVVP